jgi:hypothetical protein
MRGPSRGGMQLETKFLRMRTPVTIGSLFGECECAGSVLDQTPALVPRLLVRVVQPGINHAPL